VKKDKERKLNLFGVPKGLMAFGELPILSSEGFQRLKLQLDPMTGNNEQLW
jgi:hypothetical protein